MMKRTEAPERQEPPAGTRLYAETFDGGQTLCWWYAHGRSLYTVAGPVGPLARLVIRSSDLVQTATLREQLNWWGYRNVAVEQEV